MKKITWWLLSTATVLILLFSYHTSTNTQTAAATPPSISTPAATRTPVAGSSTAAGSTTTVTATVTAGNGTDDGQTPTGTAAAKSTAAASTPAEAPTATAAAAASGTFVGAAADTRYGPVQVQITVTNGKITAATALEYPYNDHRDQEINDYAIPTLNQEAVDAQSANISMFGGATYTSDGYLQSLQSAIDQANL